MTRRDRQVEVTNGLHQKAIASVHLLLRNGVGPDEVGHHRLDDVQERGRLLVRVAV